MTVKIIDKIMEKYPMERLLKINYTKSDITSTSGVQEKQIKEHKEKVKLSEREQYSKNITVNINVITESMKIFKTNLKTVTNDYLELLKKEYEAELLDIKHINSIQDLTDMYALSRAWELVNKELIERARDVARLNNSRPQIIEVLYIGNKRTEDDNKLDHYINNQDKFEIINLENFMSIKYYSPSLDQMVTEKPFEKIWGSDTAGYYVILSKKNRTQQFTEHDLQNINKKADDALFMLNLFKQNLDKTVDIFKISGSIEKANERLKYILLSRDYVLAEPVVPGNISELITYYEQNRYAPVFNTQFKLSLENISKDLEKKSTDYAGFFKGWRKLSVALYAHNTELFGLKFKAGPALLLATTFYLNCGLAGSVAPTTSLGTVSVSKLPIWAQHTGRILGMTAGGGYFAGEGVRGAVNAWNQKNWGGVIVNSALAVSIIAGGINELIPASAVNAGKALSLVQKGAVSVLTAGMTANIQQTLEHGKHTVLTPTDVSNILMSTMFIGMGLMTIVSKPRQKCDMKIEFMNEHGKTATLSFKFNKELAGKPVTMAQKTIVSKNGAKLEYYDIMVGGKKLGAVPFVNGYKTSIWVNGKIKITEPVIVSEISIPKLTGAKKTGLGNAQAIQLSKIVGRQPVKPVAGSKWSNMLKIIGSRTAKNAEVLVPERSALPQFMTEHKVNVMPALSKLPKLPSVTGALGVKALAELRPELIKQIKEDYEKTFVPIIMENFRNKTHGRQLIYEKISEINKKIRKFNNKWKKHGVVATQKIVAGHTDGIGYAVKNDYYGQQGLDDIIKIEISDAIDKLMPKTLAAGMGEEFLAVGTFTVPEFINIMLSSEQKANLSIKKTYPKKFMGIEHSPVQRRCAAITFELDGRENVPKNIGELVEKYTDALMKLEKIYSRSIKNNKLLIKKLVEEGLDRQSAEKIIKNIDQHITVLNVNRFSEFQKKIKVIETVSEKFVKIGRINHGKINIKGEILRPEVYDKIDKNIISNALIKKVEQSQSISDVAGILSEDNLYENSTNIIKDVENGNSIIIFIDFQLKGGIFNGRRTVKQLNTYSSYSETDHFIASVGAAVKKCTKQDKVYRIHNKNFVIVAPANTNVSSLLKQITKKHQGMLATKIESDIRCTVFKGNIGEHGMHYISNAGLDMTTHSYMTNGKKIINMNKANLTDYRTRENIKQTLAVLNHVIETIQPEKRSAKLKQIIKQAGFPEDIEYINMIDGKVMNSVINPDIKGRTFRDIEIELIRNLELNPEVHKKIRKVLKLPKQIKEIKTTY